MSRYSVKRKNRDEKRVKKQRPILVRCYCEGDTEVEYIKTFIKGKNKKYRITTTKHNTIEEMYRSYKTEYKQNKDAIYVFIFDNDKKQIDNFYNIIRKARDAGILLYYSNLCFELWFLQVLSNYNKCTSDQKEYYVELEKLLSISEYSTKYKGIKIINLLLKKEEFNEKREEVYKNYMNQIDNLNTTNDMWNILQQNPYTNICFLEHDLEEAIKHKRK